jgi:hypothetical protein
MIVEIILNRPFALIRLGKCAGIIIPWPDSVFPSMICAKVSNGEIFSVNPSPLSKDMILILPVDFLIMVLLSTELGMYSMISTMISALSISVPQIETRRKIK